MTGIKPLAIAILAGLIIYVLSFKKRNTCGPGQEHFIIASVEYGLFTESIPQTGKVVKDTLANTITVKVEIDQLYLSRIVAGLKATTRRIDSVYVLEITHVYPAVTDGRFSVDMVFKEKTPTDIEDGTSLRLRIELSEPRNALLIPVGGFYKDSGGKWVFLVEDGIRAVRRNVKLGRKNSEYIEVLEGLKAGDHVITSTYQNFMDQQSLDLSEIKKMAYR